MVAVAPSILSADFLNLQRDLAALEAGPARPDFWHVDVMDGHFVPNLTIGPEFVRGLKRVSGVPLDVHLMISNPVDAALWYAQAGADIVTFHLEAFGDTTEPLHKGTSYTLSALTPQMGSALRNLIDQLHQADVRVGLALNPATPVELLEPFLDSLDLVLVMSVHPGFGGQSFLPVALDKLRWLAAHTQGREDLLIEVDGGINLDTAPLAVAVGANLLVAGNAIFSAPDRGRMLAGLQSVGAAA
jgi:ribulose-phosphate 3-epimerase